MTLPSHTITSMGRRLMLRALLAAILLVTGCSDSTGPGQSDLVGTWRLVSVDGFPAPSGSLTWTLTGDSFVANSDNGDCVESGSYSVSGNRMTAVITNLSGPGCGGDVGDTVVFTVNVSGDTLTVIATDPDFGSATFVFTRT